MLIVRIEEEWGGGTVRYPVFLILATQGWLGFTPIGEAFHASGSSPA